MNNFKNPTEKVKLNTAIVLQRACNATLIPLGHDLLLKEAEVVVVTHSINAVAVLRGKRLSRCGEMFPVAFSI